GDLPPGAEPITNGRRAARGPRIARLAGDGGGAGRPAVGGVHAAGVSVDSLRLAFASGLAKNREGEAPAEPVLGRARLPPSRIHGRARPPPSRLAPGSAGASPSRPLPGIFARRLHFFAFFSNHSASASASAVRWVGSVFSVGDSDLNVFSASLSY